jgi:hypothetical protein
VRIEARQAERLLPCWRGCGAPAIISRKCLTTGRLSRSDGKMMATGWLHGTIAMLAEGAMALAIIAGPVGVCAAQLQTDQPLLDQRIDRPAPSGQNSAPGVNFSIDQNPAAPSSDMTGSFPRSILLPGTNTSLSVHGQIGETLGYRIPGGNPGGSGRFTQSLGPSELGVETRTPTPLGEARTVIEFGK